MKLIFIYGPPATGKLTVAKELAKLTNYKIFHNHLTVDLLRSVFKFGTKTFFDLSDRIRLEIFEAAAKEKIDGLIFTFCYSHPDDDKFVKKVKKRVEKYGGEVDFIQLYCEISELKNRVKEASRENFAKIKTKKGLEASLRKWDLFTPIPFVKSLQIDNTNISAKQVANKIKIHYNL
jgi:hypothetical protein